MDMYELLAVSLLEFLGKSMNFFRFCHGYLLKQGELSSSQRFSTILNTPICTQVMLLVFLPALFLARFLFVSATALYVASVVPCWTLTFVFLWRLRVLATKWLVRGLTPVSSAVEVAAA